MCLSLRRFRAVVLGVLALAVLASRPSVGQQPTAAPGTTVNPPAPRAPSPNTAVLGKNVVNAPANPGPGYGSLAPGYAPDTGYGTLSNTYANSGQGYGSLVNSNGGGYNAAGYGGFGMAGFGFYGTQWMMNPYEGYLSGAAAVTNANAQYQLTIQQAKIVRQQAVREALKTRRAMMEQAEYEWAHRPDPEKIRQQALKRELDRARVSPPLTEIWSGRSLNALLRNLIAQQGQQVRGPNVPLSEDNLKSINLTAGDTRGNVGLLKDNGTLQWPQPLQGELYKEAREDLSRRMKQAFSAVQLNRGPDGGTLNDLQADLKKLQETLDANISSMSPDQYVEARRYLRLLSNTATALRDPNVSNYVNGAWTPKGKNVAELVQFMRDKGLWFAPATPSDQPAYTALYHALAAFDAGMPRVARSSDNSDK
ncbi:MAG TPA: hypothetical protein VH682_14150 [Gemmataceae bacterium]|jgi:hypothetical protein